MIDEIRILQIFKLLEQLLYYYKKVFRILLVARA